MIEDDVRTAASFRPVEPEALLPDDPDPDSSPFPVAPLEIIPRTLPREEDERRG
jgi:hypothetical protein